VIGTVVFGETPSGAGSGVDGLPVSSDGNGRYCPTNPPPVHGSTTGICSTGLGADVRQRVDGGSVTTHLPGAESGREMDAQGTADAQGRDLVEQMQREAQESQLPELIGMAVQLEFIRRRLTAHRN